MTRFRSSEKRVQIKSMLSCLCELNQKSDNVPPGASSKTSHNLVCRIQLPCRIDLHFPSVYDVATSFYGVTTTLVDQTYWRHNTTFPDSSTTIATGPRSDGLCSPCNNRRDHGVLLHHRRTPFRRVHLHQNYLHDSSLRQNLSCCNIPQRFLRILECSHLAS